MRGSSKDQDRRLARSRKAAKGDKGDQIHLGIGLPGLRKTVGRRWEVVKIGQFWGFHFITRALDSAGLASGGCVGQAERGGHDLHD